MHKGDALHRRRDRVAPPKAFRDRAEGDSLSERELEVVLMVARGMSNYQIAISLHLSVVCPHTSGHFHLEWRMCRYRLALTGYGLQRDHHQLQHSVQSQRFR